MLECLSFVRVAVDLGRTWGLLDALGHLWCLLQGFGAIWVQFWQTSVPKYGIWHSRAEGDKRSTVYVQYVQYVQCVRMYISTIVASS